MALARAILGELENESQSTVRMLERVPGDKLDWTPHAKSMTLGRLAWHIAGIPARVAHFLRSGTFDLSQAGPPPAKEGTPVDVIAEFRRNVDELKQLIGAMDDEAMKEPFSLTRNGETVRTMTNIAMIRTILLNHSYHHRGQLSVYLRLLDVPVPAIYGTSADEQS